MDPEHIFVGKKNPIARKDFLKLGQSIKQLKGYLSPCWKMSTFRLRK